LTVTSILTVTSAKQVPVLGKNWYYHHLEATDARKEPQGWRTGTELGTDFK
jgi:hypothetical protein